MRVGITQRVVNNTDYFERRDALDQRWTALLQYLNIEFVIIPNGLSKVSNYIQSMQIEGFILSGGNDLTEYGGDSPERDKVEKEIITYAIDKGMPVLGVCRGMQLINSYFGGDLHKVENQVTTSMKIKYMNEDVYVNSYHNLGISALGKDLEVTGISEQDNIVKSLKHKRFPLVGIMWHPERNEKFEKIDLDLIKELFKKKE